MTMCHSKFFLVKASNSKFLPICSWLFQYQNFSKPAVSFVAGHPVSVACDGNIVVHLHLSHIMGVLLNFQRNSF